MKAGQYKNEDFTSAKQITLSKIDVKAGNMTFTQRIELGKIFQEESSEITKFEKTFQCLYNYTPKIRDYKKLLNHFEEIIEGLKFWIESERLLKYEPTPEEIRAGIKELSNKIGEFGIIIELARDFGKDIDEIGNYKYNKIFAILLSDLEKFKYRQRLNKALEQKHK